MSAAALLVDPPLGIGLNSVGVDSKRVTPVAWNWDRLCGEISAPKIGRKDGAYFTRCVFEGDQRNDKNAKRIALVILDGDGSIDPETGEELEGAPDPHDVHEVLRTLDITHCLYSSFSNGLKGARYRVVIPAALADGAELAQVVDWLIGQLHASGVYLRNVSENKPVSQPWYLPRVPNAEALDAFVFLRHDGADLPLDDILAQTAAPPTTAANAPRASVEDAPLLDHLLSGTELHADALRLTGQLVRLGVDADLIAAMFEGLRPQLIEARGHERVRELLDGGELRRMIEGAREKGYGVPARSEVIETRTNALPPPVDLAVMEHAEPHRFKVAQILPERAVTLLGGHGGAGKSYLALQLAVCLATGRPFLGKVCKQSRVVFFSGEDDARTLKHRLRTICEADGIDPAALTGGLLLLDMTDRDPVLYAASRDGAGPTAVMEALGEAVHGWPADVVIIDNGSDVFDANEIERARVREFIRLLAAIVRPHDGAVLLLAHVDKQSAKHGGSENYSGSTAWHNSVRSRLFLEKVPDALILKHEKSNYGQLAEPIRLHWRDGRPSQIVTDQPDHARSLIDATNLRAVLGLLLDFNERGEDVSPHQTAPTNAYRLMRGEATFPQGLARSALFTLLRDAERQRLVGRELYRTHDRKDRLRLVITAAGRELIGAPPAATEPDLDVAEGDE